MTSSAFRRVKVYKRFLVRRMKAMKESAFKVKLTHLTAKELGERAREVRTRPDGKPVWEDV